MSGFFAAVALCFVDFVINAGATSIHPLKTSNVPSFDWSTIGASTDLIWHECYSSLSTHDSTQEVLSTPSRKLSCALLSLPLDYHDASSPHNVSVPVLRSSTAPSPMHRGTIFMALGGGGNSRIQDFIAITSSNDFLNWFDPELEYDFVTFDNRGFGYSSPSAGCFDSVLDSALWEERMADLGGVMSVAGKEESLQVRLAAARAKGELCEKKGKGGDDIRRHMTTAYAARDMLEIQKRLGDDSLPSSDAWRDEFNGEKTPKLKFLGMSYGTVVGQTFASLYPEHVSRMVLDGAGDPSDWTGKWQMKHLIDTDAIWESFYKDCFHAKDACPLWRAPDSDLADIEKRVSEFLVKLMQRPAYAVSDGKARLITYRDVKIAIYWTTMSPALLGVSMAKALDDLMRGHTEVTFPFENVPTASDCPGNDDQERRAGANKDAGTALNCGDAEDIRNSTIVDFKEYLSLLEEQSSAAAFFQGERRIRCMGWPIRPAWRFSGPFTSRLENGSSKLSTPILFIGNKLDPMTSIHNSWQLVKDYPGSMVLEQNGRGHCALGGNPNQCTLEYLWRYFRDGTLPEAGTICGEDCNLFNGSCLYEDKPDAAGRFVWRGLKL